MVYLILGIFVIIQCLLALSLYKFPPMTFNNFDLEPEDIWPLNGEPEDIPTHTGPGFSDEDEKILSKHIKKNKKANAKLKAAAKTYRDATKQNSKGI